MKNAHTVPQTTGAILIVDDNPVNLKLLAEYLEAVGLEILIARSGESAVNRARYARPDLILLDILLPGIDGFEVCRRLKETDETAAIPVIFMTALTDTTHKIQGFHAGAVDYLTKPLQQEEVLARVTTHLRLYKLNCHLEQEVVRRTQELVEANQQLEQESEKRRQMAEALRAEKEFNETIINAPDDTVFVFDPGTGKAVRWNAAFSKASGYSDEEINGMKAPDAWYSPDDRQKAAVAIEQIYQGKAARLEMSLLTRDGTAIPFEYMTAPIKNAKGDVQYIVAIGRNITERRQLEQQRMELAIEKERTSILSRFIQSASHEFRTPLSIIGTSIYLLRKMVTGDDARHQLEKIETQQQAITRLVDSLMMVIKLDSNVHFTIIEVDVNSIIREVVSTYHDSIHNKKLDISLQLAKDLPHIQGDAHWLYRAIINLFDNAIRFTAEGKAIEVKTSVQRHSVIVEIRDFGIGMSADILPRIYESFFRFDEAQTTRGLGLGLPMTKKIIELHGGKIETESEPGQGSLFRVSLPIIRPPHP